jgi:AcrR family transcriptional regulator
MAVFRAKQAESSSGVGKGIAPHSVRYSDYLKLKIDSIAHRRKGEKTRDLLKLGAIKVLDDKGYHAMRISDICAAAGVAAATFYIYFENKEEITRLVLTEYLDASMELMAVSSQQRNPYKTILETNQRWLEVVEANAGLMRCILQLGDEVEEFRDLAHGSNRQWYERVARAILRDHPNSSIPFEVALFASYALGSMMDELARKLVIHPDPAFVSLTRMVAPNRDALAEILTVLWHHTLYGPVPEKGKLSESARQMASLVSS